MSKTIVVQVRMTPAERDLLKMPGMTISAVIRQILFGIAPKLPNGITPANVKQVATALPKPNNNDTIVRCGVRVPRVCLLKE